MITEARAKEILDNSDFTCVSIKGSKIYTSKLRGIAPIINKLMEDSLFFKNATIADVVVGKAVAMLLIYGKVSKIYARVISEPAVIYLRKYKIPVVYDVLVPYIVNRNKDDMCPMEQCVLNVNNPTEAFVLLQDKINEKA